MTIIETWRAKGPSCFPTVAEYADDFDRRCYIEQVETEDGVIGYVTYSTDNPSDSAVELTADELAELAKLVELA